MLQTGPKRGAVCRCFQDLKSNLFYSKYFICMISYVASGCKMNAILSKREEAEMNIGQSEELKFHSWEVDDNSNVSFNCSSSVK